MTETIKELVSIIIPAKNEGDHLKITLESAIQRTNAPYEIIVVDDGSIDGCCDYLFSLPGSIPIQCLRADGIGAAGARNLGAAYSQGDYLVFCDAHLLFEEDWAERLLQPIRQGRADATTPGIASTSSPDVVGYGQVLDQRLGIPWNKRQQTSFHCAILPGCCMAVSRTVFFDVGGFDSGFKASGYEDVEFSIRMWLFGYQCMAVPGAKILHLFRQAHPYVITYNDTYYNMMRLAYHHFNEERIDKCRKLIVHGNAAAVESLVRTGDVLQQRRNYLARRKFGDEWFMEKFGIPF